MTVRSKVGFKRDGTLVAKDLHIYLDGGEVAFIPDHGDHNWMSFPNLDFGTLSGGNHVLSFVHEGPADGFPDSSVTYKASLCVQN